MNDRDVAGGIKMRAVALIAIALLLSTHFAGCVKNPNVENQILNDSSATILQETAKENANLKNKNSSENETDNLEKNANVSKSENQETKDELDLEIESAKSNGIPIEYLAVINPWEHDPRLPDISPYGYKLAEMHNGIVIKSRGTPEQIHSDVLKVYEKLKKHGMKLKYVCLVGDPISIPFWYVNCIYDNWTVPSDNIYGDVCNNTVILETHYTSDLFLSEYIVQEDNRSIIPELCVGRFTTASIEDADALMDRYVNYEKYFDYESPEPLRWQNCAADILGTDSLEVMIASNIIAGLYFLNAGFTTYQSYSAPSLVLARTEIENSNMVLLYDHGREDGIMSLEMINESDLSLHPSIIFTCACNSGRIDTTETAPPELCTYQMFHFGVNIFIAPLRPGVGRVSIFDDGGSNKLGRIFMEELFKDVPVGLAMKNAKCRLIEESTDPIDENDVDVLSSYQFILYGDPAFNPYEPCNEGGKTKLV
jgi:hypothetical protein